MRNFKATNEDYNTFKKDLWEKRNENPWIVSELDFLNEFKVQVDRETALHQVRKLNSKYSTHLSHAEMEEFADYIASNEFQSKITTRDINVAIELVSNLSIAAKIRGRNNLSFASKYCHHCFPNMYPIFDSINAKYLKDHYSYKDRRDYQDYYAYYTLFCKDIGIDLENTSDKEEGFWIDKFINNIEK